MIERKKIIISVLAAFVLLGIDVSANEDNLIVPEREIVPETKPSNWYIRLTAEEPARSLKTVDAQLGEVDEGEAARGHTLKALTPFGGRYLDIVFCNPDGVDGNKVGNIMSVIVNFLLMDSDSSDVDTPVNSNGNRDRVAKSNVQKNSGKENNTDTPASENEDAGYYRSNNVAVSATKSTQPHYGDYKSNFHPYRKNTEDVWEFTVRTDDANADVVLSWRGLFVLLPYTDKQGRQRYHEFHSLTNPLIKNMKLVDMKTHKEIAAAIDGKVQNYIFNMNGKKERIFEWVVQPSITQQDVVESTLDNTESAGLQTRAMEKVAAKKAETFDLSRPPMIKEERNGR